MAKHVERLVAAHLDGARPAGRRTGRTDMTDSPFAPIEEAVAAIAAGEIVVVVDDEDRENEGDLIMAAEAATPEKIAFFVRHTSGAHLRADDRRPARRARHPADGPRQQHRGAAHRVHLQRRLPRTAPPRASRPPTGPTPSARSSTRARGPPTFARPGHIFPLRYREGGVLKRAGHTEAAVDLARMAGLYPAGVLCEVVKEDGEMARLPDLVEFCDEHDLLLISIARAHQVPPPEREAGEAGRRGPHPHRSGATSPPTCTSRSSTASSTSRR